MANQSKLKAWARYDGTNTVVTAGPIFRASKPKVGNWRQINSGLCCNTTGTTTTQGGNTPSQPTAFMKQHWTSEYDACNTTTAGELLIYSASTELVPGVTIFTDAALTTPVSQGFVINVDPFTYPRMLVGVGGILSAYTCPQYTAIYGVGAFDAPSACNGSGNTLTVYYNMFAPLGVGTALYTDSALTIPYNVNIYGNYLRLYFQAQDQLCSISGNTIQSYTAC